MGVVALCFVLRVRAYGIQNPQARPQDDWSLETHDATNVSSILRSSSKQTVLNPLIPPETLNPKPKTLNPKPEAP